jgi:hypothetical protein
MKSSQQLAKHLRDVHFGGNWTVSNLKNQVSDISWKEATCKIDSLNTIATLVFHCNYFIEVALRVLEGKALIGNDKLSFDHPAIKGKEDWENLLNKNWKNAEKFALLIETLPEERLFQDFTDPKYGNYYRNILGIIEHTHYHLGQIALLKKMVQEIHKPSIT